MSICLIVFLSGNSFGQSPLQAPGNWSRTGPGGGGYTHLTVFSPFNPDHFIVQCDMTGSYLTRDGGRSFRELNFHGAASAFAYDPLHQARMYAGGAALYLSEDEGSTWKRIFPSAEMIKAEKYNGDEGDYELDVTDTVFYPTGKYISAICPDPASDSQIYFSRGDRLYFSADAGRHWRFATVSETILGVYCDSVKFKDRLLLFTATARYEFSKKTFLLKRQPLAASMTPLFALSAGKSGNEKNANVFVYALQEQNGPKIFQDYSATNVWVSADAGLHWKQIKDSLVQDIRGGRAGYSSVSCAGQLGTTALLVSTIYPSGSEPARKYWYGALRTVDGGTHWSWTWRGGGGSGLYGVADGEGVPNLRDAWVEKAFGKEYILGSYAGMSPVNGNVYTLNDWYRLMMTTDGGVSWKSIYSRQQPDSGFRSNGLDVTTCYGIHFDPFDSNHLAVGYTDIGYWYSENRGESWHRSVQGVPQTWVNTCYWVVFDPAVKGKCWSAWSGLHDLPRTKMTRVPGWKTRTRGGICSSADGGNSWKPSSSGMGEDAVPVSLLLDPSSPAGNRTLYACVFNKGVFKSVDDGKTWEPRNNGISADNPAAFEMSGATDGTLYLVVSVVPVIRDGKPTGSFTSGAVYQSHDGAESWQPVRITGGPFFPSTLTLDPKKPDRIYVSAWANLDTYDVTGRQTGTLRLPNKRTATGGGIFLSEDKGRSWRQLFDSTQFVYAVTVDSVHTGRLYCNTFSQGAYRSDDEGKTWKRLNGYDFHRGHRVVVDRNDPERVYLTTFGSGVWHGKPVAGN